MARNSARSQKQSSNGPTQKKSVKGAKPDSLAKPSSTLQTQPRESGSGNGKKKGTASASAPEKPKAARNPLQRAASAVGRAVGKLTGRSKLSPSANPEGRLPRATEATAQSGAPSSRRIKRESDVPMDLIAESYTPTQTSLKAPFRATGSGQKGDQEFTDGEDNRWNDEDRLTNKSGDPRIGTHNRTYEPVVKRVASESEFENE